MKDKKERTRFKIKKISTRNRLSVFRSNNHIYVQLIDDKNGITLASSSSTEKNIKNKGNSKKEIADKKWAVYCAVDVLIQQYAYWVRHMRSSVCA